MVNIVSTPEIPDFSTMPVGIPRPLSSTRMILSFSIAISISVAKPAKASSMELSTISHTRW